jgi:hypothetical protein
MEYYKSVCPKCSHAIFWVGPKTGFVKTTYPKCEMCRTQTTAKEQQLDRESAAGRSYEEALASVLSRLAEKPQEDE